MTALKNLVGQKFGRLTVIERAPNKGGFTAWRCKCDCGAEVIVLGNSLKRGVTASCGCFRRERATVHGKSFTKIHRIWANMKNRCLNKVTPRYKDYGGRSISIFPKWAESFIEFFNYVSRLEHFNEDGYTLDRIDNNGNYEPGNLRWADRKTQNRNKRNNIIIEYNGELMTLLETAKLTEISYSTLKDRYHKGWRGDKLFSPVKKKYPEKLTANH